MTSLRITATALLVTASLAFSPIASAGSASAASSLPQSVHDALVSALMDEYHAEAVYAAVIDKFGAVRPFSNIIRAEQMHASYVADLMVHYGMTVPANTLLGADGIAAAVPGLIGEACAVGVAAEIENAGLYDDQLLPAVAGYDDITAVLTGLRDTSQNMHLKAFQNCAIQVECSQWQLNPA